MTNYLQDESYRQPVSDIRVTSTSKTLRFATSNPKFTLERGVPHEIHGEVGFRLRVHLSRLEKIGQVEIEPISEEATQPASPQGKKRAAKAKAKKVSEPPVAPPVETQPAEDTPADEQSLDEFLDSALDQALENALNTEEPDTIPAPAPSPEKPKEEEDPLADLDEIIL